MDAQSFQNLLLRYLTTGNFILDILISSLILVFINYVSDFDNLWKIQNYLNSFIMKKGSIIKIQGKIIFEGNNCRDYFSENFKAIRHFIFNSIKTNTKLRELSEVFLTSEEIYEPNCELYIKKNHYSLIALNNYYIEIYPNIYYKLLEKRTEKNDKKTNIELNYSLFLKSKMGTEYILNFLDICKNNYQKHIQKQKIPGLLFIKYQKLEDDEFLNFNIYNYTSHKTFDNLYLDMKHDIFNRIDYFNNNKINYQKKGKPYTIGFIFYGSPGCGKTSTIKAISNYTQRHIVEINLSKIQSSFELERLFFNTKFNKYELEQEKLLYVVEDFDADCDILFSRNFKTLNKNEKQKKTEKNAINLASILNILDGILERQNQMLIFTTNHFEKLDPAFIRPGRFDMIVEFSKSSIKNLQDMYYDYFNERINIPLKFDKLYSQAEFLNILESKSKNDVDKLLEII